MDRRTALRAIGGGLMAAALPVRATMIIDPYRFASGPTVLLRDTFTGAAGDLEAHSPEVGGAWIEGHDGSGASLDVSGSGLCVHADSLRVIGYQDLGAADVQASLTLASNFSNVGLAMNIASGTGSYFSVAINGSSGLIIAEWSGGSFVAVRGSGAGTVASGDVIVATTSGDTLTCEVTGKVSEFSYTGSPRAYKTATSHGLYFVSASTDADEIEVTSA